MSNLAYDLLRKRNLELTGEILPKGNQLHSFLIDYTIGSVAIACLLYGYFTNNLPFYWAAKTISIVGFVFTTLVIDLTLYYRYKKEIPAMAKRTASLKTRELGRIIPLWSWGLYLVVSITAILYTTPLKTQLSLALGCAVLLITGYFVEKRTKMANNSEDDELYRKSEAWTIFIIAWSFPIIIPFRGLFTKYGVDALFSLIPLVLFVLFLNSSIYKKITSI